MKKKFNYLLVLLAVCFGTTITSSAADVLIYQYRRVSRNVGQGVEFASSSRGFLIWNLMDNHFTWVDSGVADGQLRYRVTDSNPVVVSASGWNGREFTSFSGARSPAIFFTQSAIWISLTGPSGSAGRG